MSATKVQSRTLILAAGLGWIAGFGLGASSHASAGDPCNLEAQMNFGPGNNTVYDTDDGDDENNNWHGQDGQDFLRSLACNDNPVEGNDHADDVGGGSAFDSVDGGPVRDNVYGGANHDNIYGGGGPDFLRDDESPDMDNAYGGSENDFIDVLDFDGDDLVNGQGGVDDCFWDTGDSRLNCE